MIIALVYQFHVYLPSLGYCSALVSKCESTSRHFQTGKGLSRGLLHDCKNRWIVCSSNLDHSRSDHLQTLDCLPGDVLVGVEVGLLPGVDRQEALENFIWRRSLIGLSGRNVDTVEEVVESDEIHWW